MKDQLKNSIKQQRDSLTKQEIGEKSIEIQNRLFSLEEYQNSKVVMFFVSFGSEVHTHDMIRSALPGKTVVVPKIVNNEIEPSLLVDFDSLIKGKFGILEPMELTKVSYKSISLVIVPGVAFDAHGHRIGYGFGYYDKFLKKIPKAVKIGLAFDFQIADRIPEEPHDVPVGILVTEKRIVRCRK